MQIGLILAVIGALIIGAWALIEVKRMKHKIIAIFLIFLFLFIYLSFTAAFKGKEIDFSNAGGISKAIKIYSSWLVFAFNNVKTITTNAIHMNWQGNKTT